MNKELNLRFDKFFNEISNEDYTYFLENYIPKKNIKLQEERINVINKIIESMANNGRRFFLSSKTNKIASMFLMNGKIYMRNEYNHADMLIDITKDSKPKKWTHGGTLWYLTKCFAKFIQDGKPNVLFSDYWGYDEEAIKSVEKIAHELGYLKKI